MSLSQPISKWSILKASFFCTLHIFFNNRDHFNLMIHNSKFWQYIVRYNWRKLLITNFSSRVERLISFWQFTINAMSPVNLYLLSRTKLYIFFSIRQSFQYGNLNPLVNLYSVLFFF